MNLGGGFLEGSRYRLFTDGGARGNPGPAGIAFVLLDQSGHELAREGKFIGPTTNNVAEYSALILGLSASLRERISFLDCFSDSELMVRQLNGQYRVKDQELKNLFREVRVLLSQFERVSFTSIPREKNQLADRLVNQAIDTA